MNAVEIMDAIGLTALALLSGFVVFLLVNPDLVRAIRNHKHFKYWDIAFDIAVVSIVTTWIIVRL